MNEDKRMTALQTVIKGNGTFIAPTATVIGDVTIGTDSTVLFGAVIRADMASITIGNRTNIQDNAVIHESKTYPTKIGNNVSIGHGAIIHGCTIEDNCLIGMGSIILNGAVISNGSLIAAGALVSEHKIIPPNSLVMGIPGKVIRELTPDEIAQNINNADTYVNVNRRYQNMYEKDKCI
ncbi:MAG TPA: gamma carbonic anhydrase family protein [Methanocorpusculum sp.]|nr:gamma carbonic anhydrase family protein [Methanocorpusculum sp.]